MRAVLSSVLWWGAPFAVGVFALVGACTTYHAYAELQELLAAAFWKIICSATEVASRVQCLPGLQDRFF